MIPKFRAWYGEEMYDEPVIYNGEFYLDWRDFIDGKTFDGAVLMQSTGLFDKNGVEIFEGDVVEVYGEKSLKVFFSHGAFCIDFLTNGTPLHAFGQNQLEVIGNLYEHPELVEVVE